MPSAALVALAVTAMAPAWRAVVAMVTLVAAVVVRAIGAAIALVSEAMVMVEVVVARAACREQPHCSQ